MGKWDGRLGQGQLGHEVQQQACGMHLRCPPLGFTLEEAQVGPGDGMAQMLPSRASGDTALGRAGPTTLSDEGTDVGQ